MNVTHEENKKIPNNKELLERCSPSSEDYEKYEKWKIEKCHKLKDLIIKLFIWNSMLLLITFRFRKYNFSNTLLYFRT